MNKPSALLGCRSHYKYNLIYVFSFLSDFLHFRSSKHGGNLTETRAFPAEKPLSVANLLSFIVANLEPQSRIKLALSLCGEDCITEAKVKLAKEYPYMDPKLSLIQILEPLLKNHDELWYMNLVISIQKFIISFFWNYSS